VAMPDQSCRHRAGITAVVPRCRVRALLSTRWIYDGRARSDQCHTALVSRYGSSIIDRTCCASLNIIRVGVGQSCLDGSD
jgi:hypothetical protein